MMNAQVHREIRRICLLFFWTGAGILGALALSTRRPTQWRTPKPTQWKGGIWLLACSGSSSDCGDVARWWDGNDMMKHCLACIFLVMMASISFGAENPLSINVLKTERSGSTSTYLLFSVENKSDQTYERTVWSCVFLNRGEPVHEERSTVENVPPRGRAIQRIIQSYGGPFDKVECRFMSSRPAIPR